MKVPPGNYRRWHYDIAALVGHAEDPGALRVVTSDTQLAKRVRAHGAEVMGARAFRERLDEAKHG